MDLMMIIQFLVLMFIICGALIFVLHRTLVSSTDGSIKRLDGEVETTVKKQQELSKKLKDTDTELNKKQAEAKELANKMRADAEEESRQEREKIIGKAREESEEILVKANQSKKKMKTDLEKENNIRCLNHSIDILNTVLSAKAKGALDEVLINEFIGNLKTTDMSKINPDVKEIEIVSINPVAEAVKTQISSVIKEKLGRDVSLKVSTDPNLGGGLVLKFGSMALDGTVGNLIREEAIKIQENIEQEK